MYIFRLGRGDDMARTIGEDESNAAVALLKCTTLVGMASLTIVEFVTRQTLALKALTDVALHRDGGRMFRAFLVSTSRIAPDTFEVIAQTTSAARLPFTRLRQIHRQTRMFNRRTTRRRFLLGVSAKICRNIFQAAVIAGGNALCAMQQSVQFALFIERLTMRRRKLEDV